MILKKTKCVDEFSSLEKQKQKVTKKRRGYF